MHVLLCNDDGIDATGLAVLEEAISGLATVWVVAPDGERSAQSHALTLDMPLRITERGPRRWAVSGTPADCVYVALHHVLDAHPTLVISGINHGSNLGNDVFYSGTVAAAMEACLHGVPSVAVSLELSDGEPRWDTALQVSRRILHRVLVSPPPAEVMLNVNIPAVAPSDVAGVVATRLGKRLYEPMVALRRDPRGRQYCWIGGSPSGFCNVEGTDGYAIQRGWATITPLRADLTADEHLIAARGWADA